MRPVLVVAALVSHPFAPTEATASFSDTWWSLLDLSTDDVHALHSAGLGEACLQRLRERLPVGPIVSTQPLKSFAEANGAYNTTLRALGIGPPYRAAMQRCVTDGSTSACAWVLHPVRNVCGAASTLDEKTLVATMAPPRLAWWVLRGMSAFLLPNNAPPTGTRSNAARRSLGLLDGDAMPATPAYGAVTTSSIFAEGFVQRVKDAVADVATSLVATQQSGSGSSSSTVWMAVQSAFAHRRLGLWSSPQSLFHDDSSDRVRAFVHSAPTLRTDAQRAAAERALVAVKRAMMQFGTSVYFELPMSEKMLVAKIMRGDEHALEQMLTYLKTTKLAQGVRTRLAFTRDEISTALTFAAGTERFLERVTRAVALRVPSIDEEERVALAQLLAAAQPSLRALCVATAWLATQ
tara:strand:+ start:3680 stop:4900 length:1221 start_codon:yes stop_codon:yes gene_type:complete